MIADLFLANARGELQKLVNVCLCAEIDIPEVHRIEDMRLWLEDPAVAKAIDDAIKVAVDG